MRYAPLLAALALAGCGAKSEAPASTSAPAQAATPVATYSASELQKSLDPELERWLTENSPSGVTGVISSVYCQPLDAETFKCGAKGELDSGQMPELGHMTVVVTLHKDGSYDWKSTESWTADT